MPTYAISDIHGCFDEFNELLRMIKFNPEQDIIYVLGDVIDRGDRVMDALNYIRRTKNIHMLFGNHEEMMLDYYDYADRLWFRNGCKSTKEQFESLPKEKREVIVRYLRRRPFYKTLTVNGRRFFLSHAGLNPYLRFCDQEDEFLLWSREEFYGSPALEKYICIFGHTQTCSLNDDITDCSVWLDPLHGDKICIDCGVSYSGALAALRLDDGEIFYAKSIPAGFNTTWLPKDIKPREENIFTSLDKIRRTAPATD